MAKFNNITVDISDWRALNGRAIRDRVTKEMWSKGAPEEDMEAYCAAVDGKASQETIDVTKGWVRLKFN